MARRVELGCPGHLIVASDCRFRRHTQVGNYRVSTVGDYFPESGSNRAGVKGGRETVGAGETDFFETMVFRTWKRPAPNNDGCGCRDTDYRELECIRYATAGKAQAGHERMVKRYLRKAARRG